MQGVEVEMEGELARDAVGSGQVACAWLVQCLEEGIERAAWRGIAILVVLIVVTYG